MNRLSHRVKHKLAGLKIPSLEAGSFAANLGFTSGRSVVTILAQLVFTPIIVKLYDPESYGAFGFLLSLSTLFLPLFTLQYDKALFLARDEADIAGLRNLLNTLPLVLSAGLLVILYLGRDRILAMANVEGLGNGLLLVPLFIVLGAWSQTSQYMVAVRYRYKEGFLYGSTMVVGSKLLAIGYGLLAGGHYVGLAAAELFNRSMQQFINHRLILKEAIGTRERIFGLKRYATVLRKYSNFPKFELPAVMIAALARQIPIFWLPRVYELGSFGQYVLAASLLEMPMRLFGYSLSGVFYQKAARTYAEHGLEALGHLTKRTAIYLGGASLIPLLLITFFADMAFEWVFGPTWAVAGALASRLCIAYGIRLLVEPLSSILRVLGKQRNYFLFHGNFLVLRSIAVGLSIFLGLDIVEAITLYAIANGSGHLVMGIYIFTQLRDRTGS